MSPFHNTLQLATPLYPSVPQAHQPRHLMPLPLPEHSVPLLCLDDSYPTFESEPRDRFLDSIRNHRSGRWGQPNAARVCVWQEETRNIHIHPFMSSLWLPLFPQSPLGGSPLKLLTAPLNRLHSLLPRRLCVCFPLCLDSMESATTFLHLVNSYSSFNAQPQNLWNGNGSNSFYLRGLLWEDYFLVYSKCLIIFRYYYDYWH